MLIPGCFPLAFHSFVQHLLQIDFMSGMTLHTGAHVLCVGHNDLLQEEHNFSSHKKQNNIVCNCIKIALFLFLHFCFCYL